MTRAVFLARRTAAVAALALLTAAPAAAQVYIGSDIPRRGSWEVGGGVVWARGFELDSLPAQLTANEGNNASPFTLFASEWEVGSIAGLQARGAFYLSRSLAIEGGVQYSRPVVTARLSGDAEEAEDLTAEETMSRYIIDGSVLFHFTNLAFANGRAVPFVSAGAGYLRELHDGNELVETGAEYHAGGGIKVWLTQGRRRAGLRGDVGLSIRDGGFASETGRRTLPTAGASVIFLF